MKRPTTTRVVAGAIALVAFVVSSLFVTVPTATPIAFVVWLASMCLLLFVLRPYDGDDTHPEPEDHP